MHGGGEHREGQDDLGGRIGIIGDAGVARAESAGAAGRHGVGQRIEPGHTGQFQGDEGDDGQGDVGEQHAVGKTAVPFPGKAVPRHAGDFGARKGGFVVAGGEHREQGDDADAAHPGRGDPPELKTDRKRFDIVQDGSPGGGETGNTLEQGVDQREFPAVEQERQHAEKAGEHPGPHHDTVPFPEGQGALSPFDEDERVTAHGAGHEGGQEQGRPAVVARRTHRDDS